MSSSTSRTMLTLLTASSCSCSASVLRNSGSISSVRSKSNPLMLSTLSTVTLARSHLTTGAILLIARRRFSTLSRSSGSTRSHLLSSRRSAKATCSTDSFSAPSAFSSSRWRSMCLASTNVTIPSRRAKAVVRSSTKKVWATGAGSAMPVVSMTMPSSLRLPLSQRSASLWITFTRSCRTVQQMQPFIISMSSSSLSILAFLSNSASSMPTSPNSFSMTAIFFPCVAVRM
mmetsp:Transcript_9537/g.29914  ORF Transcript_9537/g.29914 Transcript_9537/m.29914 type:complete len:230 (-) Transcript_9537:280-969(-)